MSEVSKLDDKFAALESIAEVDDDASEIKKNTPNGIDKYLASDSIDSDEFGDDCG